MLGNSNFLVLVAQVSRVGRRDGCDGQGDEKKDERGAHCRFIKKIIIIIKKANGKVDQVEKKVQRFFICW